MFDDHVDELDLRRRRHTGREEFTEGFMDRCAGEPNNRTNKAAEALTGLAGALDIASFPDTSIEQHLFELAQIRWRERFTLPQLVKHDVIFACFQEVSRFLLEPRKIRLAYLRQ